MLLSEMKNQENCEHKKIAVEKIKIVEADKPFRNLEREKIEKSDGEIHEVILCLECGKELGRN